ncbi:hypothetical protein [Romboutsia sp. MSSM.1001216sp_RTP31141st1_G3_RTP31141_220114]|uniref:hypothetical protein n=1 Tax=unclassified Romboutsia TaxID=2626894 RepID=UPI0031B59C74
MSRTFAHNIFNDDLTMRNYLALYACIINPKLSYNRALAIFEIPRDKKINNINSKNEIIHVMDIYTKKKYIFTSREDLEIKTGIKPKYVSIYYSKKFNFKNRYKIEKIVDDTSKEQK